MGTDKMSMFLSIWYFVGVWGCVIFDIFDYLVFVNVY